MYNRYLTTAQQNREPEPPAEPFCERQCPHREACRAHAEEDSRKEAAHAGGLFDALSKRLANFRLDADTLVVLAVIWFVLSDSEEGSIDPELLAAIGVLLLLGL